MNTNTCDECSRVFETFRGMCQHKRFTHQGNNSSGNDSLIEDDIMPELEADSESESEEDGDSITESKIFKAILFLFK